MLLFFYPKPKGGTAIPTKYEFYAQMANHAAVQLTSSFGAWTAFLKTAARLYKYPFLDQLMIYAQRPDATACAAYDLWNDRMGRYVKRGAKGIALMDDSGDRPALRYVFDVSDTGTRRESRAPWLWTLEEPHLPAVAAALEQSYEIPGDGGLVEQLEIIAATLSAQYWNDHQEDVLDIVDGSLLAAYDDDTIGVQFRSAATISVAYTLLSRCGLAPEGVLHHEDFMPIFDFNTPASIGALGTAVSQLSEQVLRQIERTIKHYEREQIAERSDYHDPDLHTERGLPDSQPAAERAAVEAPGQVRQMRKVYLKTHRPILYNQLLMQEKLYPHLIEIEETAQRRLEQMMPQLAAAAGVTEELKAHDPMQWVGLMNNCKAQAEEILLAELIHS